MPSNEHGHTMIRISEPITEDGSIRRHWIGWTNYGPLRPGGSTCPIDDVDDFLRSVYSAARLTGAHVITREHDVLTVEGISVYRPYGVLTEGERAERLERHRIAPA